jgi:glycolate oxidase FAD binding subunit
VSTAATTTSRLVPELRAICGAEHVTEEIPQTHRATSDDPSLERLFRASDPPPSLVAYPGSADEVAAILHLANDRDFSVVPRGRHKPIFSRLKPEEVLLDTSRLIEVEHYDPADLTVGVGAGMTVAQLNEMVGADHLLFALDPPFPEQATIGGVLAAASHGPMRHGYGCLRDFCLGVRFVTGDGRKSKGGGRVVKNVAGYDMMKLLIGSRGTLAVITSASFKLFPAPRQTRTFLAEFKTWQDALKFRDTVLGSPLSPMCLELISPKAGWTVGAGSGSWQICIRASGSDAVLARYRKELGAAVTRELDGEEESAVRQGIENCTGVSRIDVTVTTNAVAQVLQCLDRLPDWCSFDLVVLGRVGAGHLALFVGPGAFGGGNPVEIIIEQLRQQVQGESSFAVDVSEGRWPVSKGALNSMRAVKQALDPRDVLNRGRSPR